MSDSPVTATPSQASDSLKWSQRPVRSSQVHWTRVEDEIVVVDLVSGRYFTLNRLGARVWELIDGELALEDLLQTVLTEFEVEEDRARRDLQAFVSEAEREHLFDPARG